MSLTWSIDKVDNWQEITDNELDRLITEAIVFHTLGIGLGDITESNWQEFYARVAFMEELESPSLSVPKWVEVDEHSLSPNQLIRLTNDSTDQLYYYDSVGYSVDGEVVLNLYYYEYAQGMGPRKGDRVAHVVESDTVIEYHDGFQPRAITPQDVHRRIGLSTNVSNESRSKWAKRVIDRDLDRLTKRAEAKVRNSEY